MLPTKAPPARLVAVYARVSTDDQNCALQLEECRSFAVNRGWRVYGEYVDMGVSGSRASRPQLDRLMKDSRARRFDTVLVWKLDRFGRSVANFVKHVEDLTSWDVRFVVASQQIDTDNANPTSRLLMHLFAAFAEFEKEMIRERVIAGMKSARKAGVHIGRKGIIVDREKIRELWLMGKSQSRIGAELKISRDLVGRVLRASGCKRDVLPTTHLPAQFASPDRS